VDNETLTIIDNRTNQTYTIPIYRGTIRATDLRQIKTRPDDFGLMTYDPAYMNTAACQSGITYLDGDAGILRYRGYPIEQLAEHCSFLEVAYLLLHGELPTADELEDWHQEIMAHTMTHENVKKFMDGFHHDAHPMGILISTVAALSTFYPEARNVSDPACRRKQVVRLIGKMPTLAAYAYRHRLGLPYIAPDPELGYTKNYMNMLWKRLEPKYVANPVLARALDVLFILHADHEQNCSTSTMRAVGSSNADPYSTTAAANRSAFRSAAWRRKRRGAAHAGRNRHEGPRPKPHRAGEGWPAQVDGLRASGLQELRPSGAHHQKGGRGGVQGNRTQPEDRYRARAGANRAFRRVLHQTEAVSQRGLLFRHHLPGNGLHAGPVHGAVRHSANGGLAGAVAGNPPGPGNENRAPAPDLHRPALP
jgi:hypothetical protein